MEPVTKNIRLEAFCANYVFGMPIPQALRQSGYELHTVSFGYSLLRSDHAQQLVEGHREFIKSRLSSSLETVIQQLDRDREFAYECENPGAAVSATMNKAKLLGFMDVAAGVPKKITIEWSSGDEASV
jgi:hypothetical protein